MCYAAPRPRCSGYAQTALMLALDSGDEGRIARAREQFYVTPRGIKSLMDRGEVNRALRYKQLRDEMFAAADNPRALTRTP